MTKPDNHSNGTRIQELTDLPPDALRVLQLTDTHLFADPEGRLLGINTLESLNQVLEHACQTLGPMDLALVTGDLVHDASPAGYSNLHERLSTLGIPVYCLPGNHDEPAVMANWLKGNPVGAPASVQKNNWLIVLLDSKLPGSEGGHLNEGQLAHLESCLAAHPDRHALVCLHHQPIPVGSAWIDTMELDNADEFFAIIDRHPQVRGILWGHVHQNYESKRNGIPLISTLSTCFQFTPKEKGFGIDEEPPGCRWLALLPDGTIKTGTLQIDTLPATIDWSSTGY